MDSWMCLRSSSAPYWSPRMGKRSLLRRAGLSGFQSMSKYSAYREEWPFSSTSCHQMASFPTPKALALQLGREARKASLAPELRVEPVVSSYVIPVHAARPCLEDGRRVEVTDPKPLQVAHDVSRIGKRESFVHLHPIGGDRDPGIGMENALHALPH